MSRRGLLLVLVLCLGALSGQRRPGAGPALPPVDAGPLPALESTSGASGIAARMREHHTGLAAFEIDRIAATIEREARTRGLSPSLVLSVIEIESGYYNFAVSRVGALGLMQIMPATGQAVAEELGIPWEGPETLFDPEANVRIGIAYLSTMQERYGGLSTALAAYNWGPGQIDRRLRRGHPVPGHYARSVLNVYGAQSARLASFAPASGVAGTVFTSAATKPSTASMAPASLVR